MLISPTVPREHWCTDMPFVYCSWMASAPPLAALASTGFLDDVSGDDGRPSKEETGAGVNRLRER